MKQLTRKRSFQIESLESRAMLAADAFATADHGDAMAALLSQSTITQDVFIARGFQSVQHSGTHGRPQNDRVADSQRFQTADIAGYRFTFVALPSLETRLNMRVVSVTKLDDRNNMPMWNDQDWTNPRTIESSPSQSLPLHGDGGSNTLSPSNLTSNDLDTPRTQQDQEPDNSGESDRLDASTLASAQAAAQSNGNDQPSEEESSVRVDRAITSLLNQRSSDINAFESVNAGSSSDSAETIADASALGRNVDKISDAIAFHRHDSVNDQNSGQRWSDPHAAQHRAFAGYSADDRYELDNLQAWIVRQPSHQETLANAARNQMLSLTANASPLPASDMMGNGWSLTQMFVGIGSCGFEGEIRGEHSDDSGVTDSLLAAAPIASAIGVVIAASCYENRKPRKPLHLEFA